MEPIPEVPFSETAKSVLPEHVFDKENVLLIKPAQLLGPSVQEDKGMGRVYPITLGFIQSLDRGVMDGKLEKFYDDLFPHGIPLITAEAVQKVWAYVDSKYPYAEYDKTKPDASSTQNELIEEERSKLFRRFGVDQLGQTVNYNGQQYYLPKQVLSSDQEGDWNACYIRDFLLEIGGEGNGTHITVTAKTHRAGEKGVAGEWLTRASQDRIEKTKDLNTADFLTTPEGKKGWEFLVGMVSYLPRNPGDEAGWGDWYHNMEIICNLGLKTLVSGSFDLADLYHNGVNKLISSGGVSKLLTNEELENIDQLLQSEEVKSRIKNLDALGSGAEGVAEGKKVLKCVLAAAEEMGRLIVTGVSSADEDRDWRRLHYGAQSAFSTCWHDFGLPSIDR